MHREHLIKRQKIEEALLYTNNNCKDKIITFIRYKIIINTKKTNGFYVQFSIQNAEKQKLPYIQQTELRLKL